MVRFKHLLGLLLFVSLLAVGCGKEDDGGDDGSGGGGGGSMDVCEGLDNHFSCKLNGEDWVAESVMQPTVFRQDVQSDVKAKRLDFFGSPNGGLSISITATDFRNGATGECMSLEKLYGTGHADAANSYSITSSAGPTYTSNATLSLTGNSIAMDGWVEITACEDGVISGTFEFDIKDLTGAVTTEVREGVFCNVAYTFFE